MPGQIHELLLRQAFSLSTLPVLEGKSVAGAFIVGR